jgi:hypothetical protein
VATEAIIFQQIVDINWDQAIYTASPNNTINVVQIAAKGSGTNIGLAITPKGTGYISAQVPNGAASGGNARGSRSVDLQMTRVAASQVASGENAGILCGQNNISSALNSVVLGGENNTSSGSRSTTGGQTCVASGDSSVAIGISSNATATGSVAIGRGLSVTQAHALATGLYATSYVDGQRSHGNGITLGRCQEVVFLLVAATTTNSEIEALTALGNRIVLRAGSILNGIVTITGNKSDGSAVAKYQRQVAIKRVVNTTSLVGSVITLGTDEAAGTSIAITADDTNDALKVGVTGVTSENWNWSVMFHGLEKNL